MASRFSATVRVCAGDRTRAIYESVNADNEFYPENPVSTTVSIDDGLVITAGSENLAHLRANLNSVLRLVQAANDSIGSAR